MHARHCDEHFPYITTFRPYDYALVQMKTPKLKKQTKKLKQLGQGKHS